MIVRPLRFAWLLLLLPVFQNAVLFGAGLSPEVCVTLAWSPSPGADIAGYRVYQGGASRVYTNTLDAGNNTSATVCELMVGTTYFFAVTSYTTNGLESPFSGEISYTVPATSVLARLKLSLLPGKKSQLSGTGPVGYQYQVLASSKWANWSAIGSVTIGTNGTFLFADPGAATNAFRSYRLRQTYP